MLDKDPDDDSSVPCGSRESEISEEEEKHLLSSGATGEQEMSDPANCQSDLRSDPIPDLANTVSSGTVLKTSRSNSSVIDNNKPEAMEEFSNEDKVENEIGLLRPLLATTSETELSLDEDDDKSEPLIRKQDMMGNNDKESVPNSKSLPALKVDITKSLSPDLQNQQTQCDSNNFPIPPSRLQFHSMPQQYQNNMALPIRPTSSGSMVPHDQSLQGLQRQPSPHVANDHSHPLTVSSPSQLMVTSPSPSSFMPHPYWPMSYQFSPHLGQPYPPMQYSSPPLYQYYQPMPFMQPYQGPLTQPLSPGANFDRPGAVPFQQNQFAPMHFNLSHGVPTQNNLGSDQQPQNLGSVGQQDHRLQKADKQSQNVSQKADVSEPVSTPSQPTCPLKAVINDNQNPISKPVVGMRLQGPRHLFTVVPVANGDLETVVEESKPTNSEKDSSSLKECPSATLAVQHKPTISLPAFAPSKSEPVSLHPLDGATSLTAPMTIEEDSTFRSTSPKALSSQMNNPKHFHTITAGRGNIVCKDDSSISPKRMKGKKASSSGHNMYHTITGMPQGQGTLRRENSFKGLSNVPRGFTVGGLGLSPFHPRGEYGVGGATVFRGRRDASVLTLPRNPYHTVTGMVSNPHPIRDYGIGGGSSSHLLNHRDDIPPYRPRGPGGIPASLASVVMPKDPNIVSPRSTRSLKRLSWGYTITENRSMLTHSSSAKQLGNTLMEENSDGVTSPLMIPDDETTVMDLNDLTVNSMGGISIEVGSTDGRAMTVRGALTSPEQLPYLPAVFRHSHLEACKDVNDTFGSSDGRQTWGNKAQFVLACIGYAVGLGNLWRFPYLCYKSGGGAFLIPYFLMLFLCGIPLLLMELAVGQYTRRGPIGALEKLCPIFKGAGVGTVIMSFLLGTYYNVIIAWAIYYLFQSFTSELPWGSCDPAWAVNCFDDYNGNNTAPNGTKSSTEEYFDEVVLRKSRGMEEMGSFRLEILLALFGAWVLVYFCLWKSIKSSGKVVYVTATLPYLLIGAFLWRALTLPGASTGLQYFFSPRWELLLKGEVWVAAAAQNFNSIGIAFGSLIAFSSYNKFNNNIVLDTWAISLTNSFTSLLSGMIVFSTLGNIALEQSKDIDEVVAQGPGLVFMVYPQALAKMPYGGIWAVLFFFMLLILGLDSQFANVEVIITSLQDGFPKWLKNNLKHHEILVLIVCLISFICGLPNVMQGGIYFFTLIDYYAANISLMYLAFFEVISIVWIYGAGRLARNVQEMTSRMPSLYFRGCWYIAAPLLIMAIWIFSVVDYKRPTYNNEEYDFPDWAIGVGWVIASLSIIPIPIFAVIAVCKAKGATFLEKLSNSFKSQIEDCDCTGGVFPDDDNPDKEGYLDHQVKLVVYNESSNELKKSSEVMQESGEKETEPNGKT